MCRGCRKGGGGQGGLRRGESWDVVVGMIDLGVGFAGGIGRGLLGSVAFGVWGFTFGTEHVSVIARSC